MGIKDPVLFVTGALVNPRTNFRPGPLGSGDESSRIWITSVLPTIRESINDHKGIYRCLVDILGYSLGGMVAQQIALERPSLVRKMLLVGTAPEGGEDIMHMENLTLHGPPKCELSQQPSRTPAHEAGALQIGADVSKHVV
jgi:pimeloyl-ACP methyl ester carboxylesterase